MTTAGHNSKDSVPALASRLTVLAEAYKEDVAVVIEDAKKAEVDTSAVRRLSSWQRKDPSKRAEQEAIDEQYRFLAGERATPAELPPDCELAKAIALYRDKNTVRQVADILECSVGKAQKLNALARAFDGVHPKMNVNKMNACREMIADDLGKCEPPAPPAPFPWPPAQRPMTFADIPHNTTWQALVAPVHALEAERLATLERRRAERAALVKRNAEIDADPLTIPSFLKAVAHA